VPGPDGAYVKLERPWRVQERDNIRQARKLMNIVASGVGDENDAIEKANALRRLRSHGPTNPPPPADSTEVQSRRRRRALRRIGRR
jgi:hypothetical protein